MFSRNYIVQEVWGECPTLSFRKLYIGIRNSLFVKVPDSNQGPTLQAGLSKDRTLQACYVYSFLHTNNKITEQNVLWNGLILTQFVISGCSK